MPKSSSAYRLVTLWAVSTVTSSRAFTLTTTITTVTSSPLTVENPKNNWTDEYGNPNTAAGNLDASKWVNAGSSPRPELAKSTPVVFDANGNVVYDKNGNPLRMYFNYGGQNYEFDGGDAIYEDINHDGNIDELDIVYLGTSNPKLNGGFGVNFKYGRWELKTSFNFRWGNKIINLARLNAESMTSNKNQCASVAHRWRKNGQATTMPRAMSSNVTTTYNSLVSDRYVEPVTSSASSTSSFLTASRPRN